MTPVAATAAPSLMAEDLTRWRHIYAGEDGATFHLVITGPTTVGPAEAPRHRLAGPELSLGYLGSLDFELSAEQAAQLAEATRRRQRGR